MRNLLPITMLAFCLSLLSPAIAPAVEVAGVDVPEAVSIGESGDKLALNGAGVRKKFVIKVYVGALYLPEKATSPEAAYGMQGPKMVTMTFVYSKVGAEKLAEGWNDGFAKNHTPEEMNSLKDRLARFNSFFPDVHKGDTIGLAYVPEEGTVVRVNGQMKGTVEGGDFYTALLKVWLGPEPADKALKKAMLGADR